MEDRGRNCSAAKLHGLRSSVLEGLRGKGRGTERAAEAVVELGGIVFTPREEPWWPYDGSTQWWRQEIGRLLSLVSAKRRRGEASPQGTLDMAAPGEGDR